MSRQHIRFDIRRQQFYQKKMINQFVSIRVVHMRNVLFHLCSSFIAAQLTLRDTVTLYDRIASAIYDFWLDFFFIFCSSGRFFGLMAPSNRTKISERSDFAVGELVFAKVRGFSPWPARIKSINATNTQYNVEFYAENMT